jgi:SPP1 family predicted phage head-tail adaptor
MNPGKLRHPVTIQHQVFTDDPDTKETKASWVDVATVRASIEPLKSREYDQANEKHSELTTRVRIRYRPGVTEGMRFAYGTRCLYIQGPPIDTEERHRELLCLCTESNPAGTGED